MWNWIRMLLFFVLLQNSSVFATNDEFKLESIQEFSERLHAPSTKKKCDKPSKKIHSVFARMITASNVDSFKVLSNRIHEAGNSGYHLSELLYFYPETQDYPETALYLFQKEIEICLDK